MRTEFSVVAVPSSRKIFLYFFGLLAVLSSVGGCARCAPGAGATLTDKSKKDPACVKEIEEAMQAVVKHLGMKTHVTKGDVDGILGAGKVVKGYSRDGVQYGWEIGLRKKDGHCRLMAYKREKRQPGKSSTSWADYGSVELSVCHCR